MLIVNRAQESKHKPLQHRMRFHSDQGFGTDKMEVLEKRLKLQQELEQLSPAPEV
jgi:hypothetical protein